MADLYPPSYNMRHYALDDHNDDDDSHDQPPSPTKSSDPPKPEAKPQATFLTKLYAYVFRP